jgi:hypothetical protein
MGGALGPHSPQPRVLRDGTVIQPTPEQQVPVPYQNNSLKGLLQSNYSISTTTILSLSKLLKGIVSRDGVSTETICVQFRPKQPTAFRSHIVTKQTGEMLM